MTAPIKIEIVETVDADLAKHEGVVVAFYRRGEGPAELVGALEALNAASEGQAARALVDAGQAVGDSVMVRAPHGLKAPLLALICAGAGSLGEAEARKLGAAAAVAMGAEKSETACADLRDVFPAAKKHALAAAFAYGAKLRGYRFDRHKSEPGEAGPRVLQIAGAGSEDELAKADALADGVLLARDLVNEPANVLTPRAFADRIRDLGAGKGEKDAGLVVEILNEEEMEKLGMRALLAVGRGSRKDSHLAIMRWSGGKKKDAPIAFVGKGVCFDTGGVSLKPPAGMEEMTMDMGGAAVVVGAMLALARRKAPVNVIGIVGLVENMPDGDAQRPGDVIEAMSGKTIEVINTDAEGRLVLADALWHAQEEFKPRAIVDLATLTGAAIIALGHANAALFANDDELAAALLDAAAAAGEGLWRMPLGKEYDQQIKSRIADMKNTGGRPAGSVTAAQFLQRFIQEGRSWAHIDIAGVTLMKEATPLAPKGASGWGVATLVRYAETA